MSIGFELAQKISIIDSYVVLKNVSIIIFISLEIKNTPSLVYHFEIFSNHVLTKLYQPNASSVTKTIPHHETVAGEAYSKESTSNNILISTFRRILCPFAKHNKRLSSNTEFIFSIQRASTGPSKQIHFCILSYDIVAYLI